MPLHLLGKKSWNVYNQDNIERVRRDEEQARLAQKEVERRSRDDAAADRLRLLRGEEEEVTVNEIGSHALPRSALTTTGKRKREHEQDIQSRSHGNAPSRSDDPLDHISNMRFRDAAGRNSNSSKPWYSDLPSGEPPALPNKDVWGNEDAGRQVRDRRRLDASDPLAAIKKGVKQLREAEKQKAEWRMQRERDLGEVEELATKHSHRDGGRHRLKIDSTREKTSFLNKEKRRGEKRRHGHRTRHRSRSPDR